MKTGPGTRAGLSRCPRRPSLHGYGGRLLRPRRYENIDPVTAGRHTRMHAALLERGIYLAPSAYEVIFVSLAHDDAAIDATIGAFRQAVSAARG